MADNFNFLKNPFNQKDDKGNHKNKILRALFYPVIFIGIFALIFSFQVLLSGENLVTGESGGSFSFLNVIGLGSEKSLQGEDEGRINILLTGMGGLGHSGPFLTDTMILVSIDTDNSKVSMLSIPRDLSVSIPGYGWRKVNSVNHYGELNNPSEGAKYTADYMSSLLNIPIHYYVRVDFKGFEQLIDELDGLDIYVDNGFSDSQFPDNNYGYQTITFAKGWNTMNGVTALNYARSRHGNNGESSDFARSQRQQKTIKALKDKIISSKTLLSIKRITSLYKTFNENVSTNMESWEILRFAKLAKSIEDQNINTLVLDNSTNGLLYSTVINGAYLLMPKDESFYEIQQVVMNIFNPDQYLRRDERVDVEIRNGTKIDGLAYTTSIELTRQGFEVSKIGNAINQDYEKTVIYDLTNGQKNFSLERIKTQFNANVATFLPQWLEDEYTDNSNQQEPKLNVLTPSTADFLIILGQDYAEKK